MLPQVLGACAGAQQCIQYYETDVLLHGPEPAREDGTVPCTFPMSCAALVRAEFVGRAVSGLGCDSAARPITHRFTLVRGTMPRIVRGIRVLQAQRCTAGLKAVKCRWARAHVEFDGKTLPHVVFRTRETYSKSIVWRCWAFDVARTAGTARAVALGIWGPANIARQGLYNSFHVCARRQKARLENLW